MAVATVTPFHDQQARGSMDRGSTSETNAVLLMLLNRALTAAGVARGTTAQKVKTVNALTYNINGTFFSKAATDDFWTLSGTTVPALSWQKYALLIDGTGAASIQEAAASNISVAAVGWRTAGFNNSPWHPIIAMLNGGTGKAVVAVLTIQTAAATTFIPGTTALNAAGITATFADGVDSSLCPAIGNEQSVIIGAI